MSHNRQVLVVAYLFPPSGGAGVQRTTKFVKYLPEFGWQPVILTVKPGHYRLQDPSLQAELPLSVAVNRTSSLQLPNWLPWRVRNWIARWLLVVDEYLGWYPFAVRRGRQLLARGNVAAIYTTSAPYTNHLIGLALHRRFHLPWIVDLRDPWIGNYSRHHPTPLHRRLDARLEAQVIRAADHVLVTSQPNMDDLIARFPGLDPGKFSLLPNGFDQADFTGLAPMTLPSDRFTIVYSGSFYTQERSPQNFLNALASMVQAELLPRHALQVFFVGNISPQVNELIKSMGFSDLVTTTGYLPHQQSIAYLLSADLLLIIMGQKHAKQGMLTGKVFEYLAAAKPILALAPPCADADLVREAQAGLVVPPDDIPAIANTLVELYTRWSQGRLDITPRPEVVARYERRNQTAVLARLLDRITAPETVP